MSIKNLQALLGQTDIYLLDQLMKGRYSAEDQILDAGCGNGRNLHWFLQNQYNVFGVDINPESIAYLQQNNSAIANRFHVAAVENMPFPNDFFEHIISSAVLHFAHNTAHFLQMLAEMVRVVKPGGTLFIRMTSNIGIENAVQETSDGVYKIPDGSTRFLLTRYLLEIILQQFPLAFLEPLKTVNVSDLRCMSTLLLRKTS
jgi:tellurite methyltransferase